MSKKRIGGPIAYRGEIDRDTRPLTYVVLWTRKTGVAMREGFPTESSALQYARSLHQVGVAALVERA